MAQTAIFGPVFATILLTFAVWVYLYVRRIHFITRNQLSTKDLAVPGALAQRSPPAVSNPSDDFKNLFEMPVLLYALAAYLFATSQGVSAVRGSADPGDGNRSPGHEVTPC
jgi:hypothetical protein